MIQLHRMPRKTKKQKIKALLHQTHHQISQSPTVQKQVHQTKITESLTINASTQSTLKESTLSITEGKKQIISDIYKSIALFTLLAIFQYILYYSIVNNIIKI